MHAMLDGRQTVLLRKGGIHEKRFTLDSPHFLFFPTVAHSHAERVRPEHRDLLAAAADGQHRGRDRVAGRREGRCRRRGRPARGAGRALRRCISGPPNRCAPTGSTSGRRHRLTVLVVQVSPLAEPVRLRRMPEYAGCTSWVQLPVNPMWVDAGARRRDAARHRRAGARLSRLTAAGARGQDAAATRRSPRCTVCVAVRSRLPVTSGSPVPRLRGEARMRSAGDQDPDA